MKVIEYSSENFWELLDEHLSLRHIETDVKIDQLVKSILEDVKKFGDEKIIQFTKDFDKVSLKKNEIKVASDGWIVAGFVFALLGGYIGIAMGMNYAFGNYKSETKTTGVVMLVISVLSFSIWRSL